VFLLSPGLPSLTGQTRIHSLLAPLVRGQLACVLPMQSAASDKPWLLEVCPASTLQKLRLYLLPYKKSDKKSRVRRARIIEGLEETGTMRVKPPTLRLKILNDWRGDALDSVIIVALNNLQIVKLF
jgi:hypothetical protein